MEKSFNLFRFSCGTMYKKNRGEKDLERQEGEVSCIVGDVSVRSKVKGNWESEEKERVLIFF